MILTKYKIGSLLVATTLLFSGCNSLFDDAPNDKISDESVWSNGQLLDEYVNGWYRNMNYGFKTLVTTSTLLKNLSRYYLPWFGDQLSVGKTD